MEVGQVGQRRAAPCGPENTRGGEPFKRMGEVKVFKDI